jgi:hypothetical protein
MNNEYENRSKILTEQATNSLYHEMAIGQQTPANKKVVDINALEQDKMKAKVDKEKEKYDKQLQKNKEYNDLITSDIPDIIKNAELPDGNILVKLFKFAGEQNNEGLLLEPKWKPYETSGGKQAFKADDFEYSSRAIVIRKPSQAYLDTLESKSRQYIYTCLEEQKSVVWLNANQTIQSYVFLTDRKYPSIDFEGYLSIPVSAIQLIEK